MTERRRRPHPARRARWAAGTLAGVGFAAGVVALELPAAATPAVVRLDDPLAAPPSVTPVGDTTPVTPPAVPAPAVVAPAPVPAEVAPAGTTAPVVETPPPPAPRVVVRTRTSHG